MQVIIFKSFNLKLFFASVQEHFEARLLENSFCNALFIASFDVTSPIKTNMLTYKIFNKLYMFTHTEKDTEMSIKYHFICKLI